ncbi:MAG: F0F1 ATP synthase subunit B [Nitrospirota bacterium]|nr:F0F1 ATP synthase subunit B [Nitrospirota bacterium]
MPQFDFQFMQPTMFWSAVSFLVLLVLLWRMALPGILGQLENRRQRIQDDLDGAEKARREADRIKADLEANLKAAKSAADEIIARAQEKAAALLGENEKRMQDEAARILADAQRAMAQERTQAVADLRKLAADLAVTAAGKFVSANLDEAAQLRLVDESLAELQSHYRR